MRINLGRMSQRNEMENRNQSQAVTNFMAQPHYHHKQLKPKNFTIHNGPNGGIKLVNNSNMTNTTGIKSQGTGS